MKVAFVGKGGSGKTTLAALFSRYAAQQKRHVLAIDADINQHLAVAIGMTHHEANLVPPLGLEVDRIKEHLKGSNQRITSTKAMIKTTPPGQGSNLITPGKNNPVFDHFIRRKEAVELMAVGPFDESDIGTRCYHSKTGAVELILNHMVDDKRSCIVVDMTAGADAFASGLFTRFDLTVLVVEPTVRSLGVYDQYCSYAHDHDVTIKVMANKLEDPDDFAFVSQHVGEDLIGGISRSSFIKTMEKGRTLPINELEGANTETLQVLLNTLDQQEKNWDQYQKEATQFHHRNAHSWANDATGQDLTQQIDPEFSLLKAATTILNNQSFGEAA